MANLYGVANPNPLPQSVATIGGTDIACPAGSETNIIQAAPALPTVPGVYYPMAQGWTTLSFGATPPTNVQMSLRVNNGSDLLPWTIWAGLLIANNNLIVPLMFYGYNLIVQNPTGVYNFQVGITPLAQAITARNGGTLFYVQWVRASDQ